MQHSEGTEYKTSRMHLLSCLTGAMLQVMQNSSFPENVIHQHSSFFGFVLALSFVWKKICMKETSF